MSPAATTTLRTAASLGLVLAAYLLGRAHGIREATEALAPTRLTTWGVQVEAGAPTYRIVPLTGTAPPAAVTPEGNWQRVALTYWVQRADRGPVTSEDVAASLREWCEVAR